MHKPLNSFRAGVFVLFFVFVYTHFFLFTASGQFTDYNRTTRSLNYYLVHLDHLLSYHEQTTLMVKDISSIYANTGAISISQANFTAYRTVDMPRYRMRMDRMKEAIRNKYDVGTFIQYNKKTDALPDSVRRLFKDWLYRADTIASSQTDIAVNLLAVIENYSQLPSYVQRDMYRVHQYINAYHSRLADLQNIRDSATSAALEYYENMRAQKKYPLSVYTKGMDDLLQINVYLNLYFSAMNREHEEAARIALRKVNDYIQAYLKDEYIYRKNNDALPGHHAFPFNEEVHIRLSNSLKEIAFQLNRYLNNPAEKVDSAYFSRWVVNLTNMLNVVSFSHDENVDVRKKNDIPERYHADMRAMLRYDFLMYRYDTYRNSQSNKNTSPLPLSWARYVYTFKYEMPKPDSTATPPMQEIKPAEVITEEKETIASNVQIIKVQTDSLSLFFYDNAEVDNDTITISINGVVVAPGVRLDSEPFELKIGFSQLEKIKEVTVSANNLGLIPPNTAYLKVTAGDAIHRLYLFTTKKTNAVVRIINQKEVKIDE